MSILLGILAGIGLPIQTSMNTRLKQKVGSLYRAALVSFSVSELFLLTLLLVTGQGLLLPLDRLAEEPWWVWTGGVCGVAFLSGNILLLSGLGSVRAVILPVLGQILMGLFIDSRGLFGSLQTELTVLRAAGAALVLTGVVTVSLAKERSRASGRSDASAYADGPAGTLRRLLLHGFGVAIGMLSAIQIAVNGYVRTVTGSPIRASVLSFSVGIVLLTAACLLTLRKGSAPTARKQPWWIWAGGIAGSLYMLANVYLSGIIGTGATVVALLVGSTVGGLLIDHFGLFGAERKPVNDGKALGVAAMIVGAAAIKLF